MKYFFYNLKFWAIACLICASTLFVSCGDDDDNDVDTKARTELKQEIESYKSELPIQLDEVTTLTDIKLDGNDLIYTYSIVETKDYSFAMLKENAEIMKSRIISSLRADSETISNFKASKVNVIYHYECATDGESFDIAIKNSEL